MSTADQWKLVQEINTALGRQYGPVMAQAVKTNGLPEQWIMLWLTLEWEPDAISGAKLQRRDPYSSIQRQEERLQEFIKLELLRIDDAGEYRLTDAGRTRAKQVIHAYNEYMPTLQPLAAADLERLAVLLLRIVEACVAAPEPPGKEALLHNRNSDEGSHAPAMLRIAQYLTDLPAYRDESHVAAWKQYQISGPVWETFTFIWKGDAKTAAEIAEKLPFRGHTVPEYETALKELVARGWIAEVHGETATYQVTEQGAKLRQSAEELTDQYFFAPWSALNPGESTELENLLSALHKSLELMPVPSAS